MIFQEMKLGTSVISHFHVILTEQSISETICIIQGHLQGQKVNFRVKQGKIYVLTDKARKMCNTAFSWVFDWKIHLKYYFGDSRS